MKIEKCKNKRVGRSSESEVIKGEGEVSLLKRKVLALRTGEVTVVTRARCTGSGSTYSPLY